MSAVVSFIINFLMSILVVCILNFHFSEKRQYRELKILNTQLDIILKVTELKDKGIPIPNHMQRYIEELYKITARKSRGDNCKSMLTFPLKKEWYEKIKSGEKTIEYREVKPYWTRRIVLKFFRPMFGLYSPEEVFKKVSSLGFSQQFDARDMPYCALRVGYTRKMITARISQIEVIDGKDTDLHIDKPVYAIHFKDVR